MQCIYPSPPFVVGHDDAVKVPPPPIMCLAVVSGVRSISLIYFGPPVTVLNDGSANLNVASLLLGDADAHVAAAAAVRRYWPLIRSEK